MQELLVEKHLNNLNDLGQTEDYFTHIQSTLQKKNPNHYK